jgi:acetamidase/formamidase
LLHELPLTADHLHGDFDPRRAPALTVQPGDRVAISVPDAGWNLFDQPDLDSPNDWHKWPHGPNAGHALAGPIAVEGATPDHTLEVRILAVRPCAWGWTAAGGIGTRVERVLGIADGPRVPLLWRFDEDRTVGRSRIGAVDLRPFPGVVGMPPPEPGHHSTIPPRRWGGNLDCRELCAGSTLLLPVSVPGALLSLGDGHAAQGDGEVSGLAVETGLERLVVELHLRDGALRRPRALTDVGPIAFGLGTTLDEASEDALRNAVDWISERHGLPRPEAVMAASVAVDLRVTQCVNGVVGVHAVLREDRWRIDG